MTLSILCGYQNTYLVIVSTLFSTSEVCTTATSESVKEPDKTVILIVLVTISGQRESTTGLE